MIKKIFVLLCIIIAFLFSCQQKEKSFDSDKYLNFSLNQVYKALESLPDINKFPRSIPTGSIEWEGTNSNSWTSGFWPGILWYLYEFSNDGYLKSEAQRRTSPLKSLIKDGIKNHDLGFMVFCSFGNGYRISHDEQYKSYILEVADTLATLFNPNVGTLLSWPGRKKVGNIQVAGSMNHNTIMDNMMNLELLFWASKNGGNTYLKEIAVSHAQKTMKDFLRSDYSSYHVIIYDSITGEIGYKITHQGYSNESMWARGQAWGIYGFTTAYRETGKKEFLETAMNMAKFFVDKLPKDYVPYWDFNAPNIPSEKKDASAAAIAASALLELSILNKEHNENEWLLKSAQNIIESLSLNYLSDGSDHAILRHSVGNKNSDSEVDVPIIYADYYYIEALLKLKKINKK